LDGAFLRCDGGQGGGELGVALLFAVGGLIERGFLLGERDGKLSGVAVLGSPGVGKQGYGEEGGGEKDSVHGGIWHCFFGQGSSLPLLLCLRDRWNE